MAVISPIKNIIDKVSDYFDKDKKVVKEDVKRQTQPKPQPKDKGGVRVGDTVFRGGEGFSERKPTAREVLNKELDRGSRGGFSRGGGSSGGSSRDRRMSRGTTQEELIRQEQERKARQRAEQQRQQQIQKQIYEGTIAGQLSNQQAVQQTRMQEEVLSKKQKDKIRKQLIAQDKKQIQPKVIEPFTKKQGDILFKRPEQLEIQRSLIGQLGDYFKRQGRELFNERTGQDIVTDNEIIVGGGGKSKLLDKPIQKDPFGQGTIINTASGYSPTTTPREQIKEDLFLTGGGISTPIQFTKPYEQKVEEFSKKAQSKLDREITKLQKQINTGELSLSEAEKIAKKKQKEIEKQQTKQLQKEIKLIIQRRQSVIKRARPLVEEGKGKDISPVVDIGTTIGLTATPTGQGLLVGRGGLTLFSSVSKPTTTEKVLTAGSGLLDIGMGSTAFRNIDRSVEKILIQEKTKALSKQGFKASEVRIVTSPKTEVSVLRAAKTKGGFRTDLKIVGKIEKLDDFNYILPRGEGTISTVGKINRYGRLDQPVKNVFSVEAFEVGSKGVSIPLTQKAGLTLGKTNVISRARTSASFVEPSKVTSKGVNKISQQLAKSFKKNLRTKPELRTNYFGSLGFDLGDDVVLSTGGNIDNLLLSDRGVAGTFKAKDLTLTKILRPQADDTAGTIIKGRGGNGKGLFTQTQQTNILSGIASSTGQVTKPVTKTSTSFTGLTGTARPTNILKSKTRVEPSTITRVTTSPSSLIKPTTKPRTKTATATGIASVLRPRSSTRTRQTPSTTPTTTISSLIKPSLKPTTRQTPKTKTDMGSTLSPPSLTGTPRTSFNTGFNFIPPRAFPRPSLRRGKRRTTSRPTGFRSRFTPSFTGVALKIKTPRSLIKSLTTKQGFLPFTIRGTPTTTPKKKKKKPTPLFPVKKKKKKSKYKII